MDVDAVIRRAPELALIDELAHTNAPGMRNEKRYQDIEEVLAAGIDVISTVNVQHLESLNDAIAELTDVRVRETFPTACSRRLTRSCSSTSRPKRSRSACAPARSIPATGSRRRSPTSSAARTSRHYGSSRSARGRRGRRGPPAHERARPAQPAGGRRARARAGRAAAEVAADPAPRLALLAAAGLEIDALWMRPPVTSRPPTKRRSWRRCGGSPASSASTSSKRRATISSTRLAASPTSVAPPTSSSARRTSAAASRSSAARCSPGWCASTRRRHPRRCRPLAQEAGRAMRIGARRRDRARNRRSPGAAARAVHGRRPRPRSSGRRDQNCARRERRSSLRISWSCRSSSRRRRRSRPGRGGARCSKRSSSRRAAPGCPSTRASSAVGLPSTCCRSLGGRVIRPHSRPGTDAW